MHLKSSRLLIPLAILFAAYTLSLAIASYEGFPEGLQSGHRYPYLADKPVGEDGFYMLTVAWNIASGRGVVYNYDVLTTGIQPLSTSVYAIIAWMVQMLGGDKWSFIRSILVLGGVILLLFGHLVGKIAQSLADSEDKVLSYAFGFVGVVFSFALFRWFTYGLETGIYLIVFSLCVIYTLKLTQTGKFVIRDAVVLGIIAGVAAWARIDFGLVFFVFLLILLLRNQATVPWVLVAGCTALLIISPWFLYNHSVTDHWLPSSGTAQSALIASHNAAPRIWAMIKALLSYFTPWVYSNTGGILIIAAIISLLMFLWLLFYNNDILRSIWSTLRRQSLFITWFVAVIVLVLAYVIFFWSGHFYQRYAAPIAIPLTAIMAVAVAKRIRLTTLRVQTFSLYLLPICFFVWAFLSLHTGRVGNGHAVTAKFIQEHFESSKIGAFQSGVVGYFNPNVVNLDGKVNQAALDYARDGQLDRYVDAQDIDVIIDWPSYIDDSLDTEWIATNWGLCGEQLPDSVVSICLQRKTFANR